MPRTLFDALTLMVVVATIAICQSCDSEEPSPCLEACEEARLTCADAADELAVSDAPCASGLARCLSVCQGD